MKKFKVNLPIEIQNKVFYKEGKTKILELNSTIEFIQDVGKYKLTFIKDKVLNNDQYWLTIRNLKHKNT